jgi:ATP/maltotriose-dependent transcriptional regulator MalT
MLAIDALRNARNPQKLLANLTETDDIEHYLLREVDDSLSETEREVMEGLAILGGHPGTRDAIEAVVEQRRLRRILSDLRLRNLIIVSESSDDGTHLYRQHAMLQAFYYESLSKRERNKLHRRAADYYSEEADWLKAARHLLRAGEEQQAAQLATAHFWQSINQGEAGSLGSLLSQIDRTQLDWHQQTDVLLAQGKVATLQRNSEQARTTYQETINLLQNRADAPEIRLRWSQACRGMGNLLEYEAPHDALQWLEQGKEKLQGVAEAQHEQALMHHRTGSVYLALGDYAQAEQELTQSMTLLTADDLHARADVLMNLGVVYCCRGEVAQGKACYQQAYDIYQQVHHYWGMLGIRGNLGYEMRLAGDWTGSIAEYTTMRDMAIQLGSITHQVTAELNLGLVMMNMGDHEAAWKHLSTCLELARTVNLREFEIASLASLADLHIRWQEPAEAAPLLEEAARLAHEFDARDQLPEIYRLQARIALAHDELDAALELAQRAEQTARSVESDFDTGLALRVLGQVLHAHGEHTHAMHAYEQSLHLLQEDPYETARTQRQWATSLAETGNHEQARTLLHTAHATFTQLGATADLEEVNALSTCTG